MKKLSVEDFKKKYPFSVEFLQKAYIEEGRTIKEMCPIMGVKSDITASRILKAYGINTNNNERQAKKSRKGMDDKSFKQYLLKEYFEKRRSINALAEELNVSHVIVARYLKKYGITLRTKNEQLKCQKNPNYKGGRHICSNGYVEIVVIGHPATNVRGYVYEHRVVAEKKLGRYLRSDEVVHHIDGNKTNNAPENLIVLSNNGHAKLHSLLKQGLSYDEAIKGVISK